MDLDPFSPAAPARVRVLLLPAGRIKRSRFLSFVKRLRPHREVQLQDVSPDGRPNRTMFSPLAFPTGRIVYDLTTTVPPESHLSLSPFELFREPLVVVGIADSAEFSADGRLHKRKGSRNVELQGTSIDAIAAQLEPEMAGIRESFPKALVHQTLLFDFTGELGPSKSSHKDFKLVPPVERSKTTTMKTIMCDLSSLLLAEMTTFARSIQGLPSIESPASPRGARWTNAQYSSRDRPQTLLGQGFQGSEQSPGSRSDSPADVSDRNHRMSTPIQLPPTSESQSTPATSRTTSPPPSSETPPLSPKEDVSNPLGSPPRNAIPAQAARTGAGALGRDNSRDRVSLSGFGSGSVSERARNKGKGRVGLVIGSLYLQAGRWGDALRELVESATIAKSNSDHLWHAKALENILITLLMHAWAGLDFQIPQICYPIADKSSTSVKSPYQTPSGSTSDISTTKTLGAPNRLVSLRNLANLLPDLVNLILNLYARAANFAGESLPQVAYSDSVVRFAKLLATIHICDSVLDDGALRHIVLHEPLVDRSSIGITRLSILPSRCEITSILFRAFPSTSAVAEEFSAIDKISVLSGIASVLSILKLRRKKALVLRELVNTLIPALVQARKVGAAELGIHPAAGIAALNALPGQKGGVGAFDLGEGDVESGIQDLLASLGQIYGVVGDHSTEAIDSQPETQSDHADAANGLHQKHKAEDSNDAVTVRILQNIIIRSFGSQTLKTNVLRSCINLCEALPDFSGVLRFTTDLLRTSGSGIAPKPDGSDAVVRLEAEEQRRLATTISRTVGAARKLGLQEIQTEFWDEFLVRGVEALEGPVWLRPTPYQPKELHEAGATEQKEKSPFIYNPFLRATDYKTVEKYLVAGEYAEFKVSVQNPYDFEIEIEQLSLETAGPAFESLSQAVTIGPYRTQMVYVSGMPHGNGQLEIIGCVVKVKGCRKRRFPIFVDPWSPDPEIKVKAMGVSSLERRALRPSSTVAAPSESKDSKSAVPKISSLSLTVIPEQPVVVVKSTTLSQSAIMVLQGETKSFSITLENVSKSTPADLFLFSFLDSTSAPTKAAMNKKDILPADLYELELLFSRKPAFKWVRSEDLTASIAPGSSATFEIQVLGKPGLTDGTVQIDYSYLGRSQEELTERFFTRQITLPVNVTVNASIELIRTDILPLAYDFPLNGTETSHESFLNGLGFGSSPRDQCLILLDLRNAWPNSLTVTISVHKALDISNEVHEQSDGSKDYVHTEALQPGQVSRLVLPLPRFALSDPFAPVPTLNPANERQFVVSTSKTSPQAERANREAFWLREEILKTIEGSWEEDATERSGTLELRSMRLSTRMIETVRLEEVGIDISARNRLRNSEGGSDIKRKSRFQVLTDEFFVVATKIQNRTSQPIHPLLRLQPNLRNQSHNLALDISKFIAWNGLLQQILPTLQPDETIEIQVDFCMLSRGEFEIGATVEEIRPWEPSDGQRGSAQADGRDLTMRSLPLGEKERELWHSRKGCIIIATDHDDER